MTPNIPNIKKMLEDKFGNNKAAMAAEFDVDRGQISNIIKTGKGAGARFFGGLMRYCKETGLNFEEYIFLPSRVNNFHAYKRRNHNE